MPIINVIAIQKLRWRGSERFSCFKVLFSFVINRTPPHHYYRCNSKGAVFQVMSPNISIQSLCSSVGEFDFFCKTRVALLFRDNHLTVCFHQGNPTNPELCNQQRQYPTEPFQRGISHFW